MTDEERNQVEDQAPQESEADVASTPRRRATRSRTPTSAPAGQKSESRPTRRRTKASADDGGSPTRRRTRASRATAERDSAEQQSPAVPARPMPRLLQRLRNEVGPRLMQEFGYTSAMQIPRLSKVVVNIGLGEALQNPRAMENASRDLGLITGQRPVTTRAKKSVAGFKIREGMPIGLTVTVRGRRMYEFVDRLISSALPRVRDFQGVSRDSFDGRGNYSLGIREQVIFPEIDYNSIDRIRGLQVVICTTAETDREGLRLLEELGMPFARSREATRVA